VTRPRGRRKAGEVRGAAPDASLALALFDHTFSGPTWRAWRAWLCAVLGVPMAPDEWAVYARCTACQQPPTAACREVWTVAGRRAGKSRLAAFVAVFLAAVRTYRLAPGERAVVLVIAPSRAQSSVILGYVGAMLEALPGAVIARRTVDAIDLGSGVSVQVQSASFRTPRGYTVVGVVADEIAFWRDDSGAAANPDVEIIRAVRPSLASVPGSLLVAISSPYAARGQLYQTHERHYGRDSDVLVWQADTRTMNPTIPERLIEQALEEDPSAAAAEWMGQFRADLESLFSRAALDAVIARGRFELEPKPGIAYIGFLDPSGGSADSMTLAIAHRDPMGRPVLDCLREVRPPFSPEQVCQQFAQELKRYGSRRVFSDTYAAEWPREQFAKLGIAVEPSPLTRSELYLELLPAINSGGCELLDNARLLTQLVNLERRTGRSGKDAVDHPRGGHDDLANAAAGALVMAVRSVGVLAPLPAAFTLCVNAQASAPASCPLLLNGPWWPTDPFCWRHCSGLQGVRPVYEDYRRSAAAMGDTPMTPLKFLTERYDLDSSPLTRRVAYSKAVEAIEPWI